MTVCKMAEDIRAGKLSSLSLVEDCLAKIEDYKHLNAVIEINPDAAEIAKIRDAAPDKSGILHGIPVLLKDNINTGDKMRTTAGSLALTENIAAEDAPAARLLREAGAVILGKANMTEFANFMSDSKNEADTAMPNGYSSRGGQCQHPTHPEADPSGSSTGSAVAVAAGLCSLAVGSETYGSIISPAQHCGVAGLKPTDGLISKEGVIPISFTQDTLGPFAACVEDTALLLSALSGRSYQMATAAENITVGISRWSIKDNEWLSKEWLLANEALVPKMEGAGMKTVKIPDEDSGHYAEEVIKRFIAPKHFVYPILDHEFQYAMDSYLKAQNNPSIPQSLKEIIEYNKNHHESALKYNQGTLIHASKISKDWQNEPAYIEALAERKAAISNLDDLFDEFKIDVLLLLSAHCGLPAATGFPSITLPIGKTEEGLPIGICMLARRFNEDVLLSAAKVIEAFR